MAQPSGGSWRGGEVLCRTEVDGLRYEIYAIATPSASVARTWSWSLCVVAEGRDPELEGAPYDPDLHGVWPLSD